MEYKTTTIKITDKDIKQKGSYSGLLIDELAFSAGQWTKDDLFENNCDYDDESAGYILEHFDFENEFLKTISKKQAKKYKKDLSKFDLDLHDYIDEIKELVGNEDLEEKCKTLFDELQAGRDEFWKQLTKEWLYGDYSNYRGVVYEIGKYYGAEDTIYNHKKGDSFTFIFDIEDLHENYCGCGEYASDCKEYKEKDYKQLLLNSINNSIDIETAKEKRKKEEREAEYKRQAEYRAKQAKEKENELLNKLNKII
jgi:hypothetical protein